MKTALVMPGGGARGAYQAGVLSRMGELFPEFEPSIVTGVSVGAINAAFLGNHPGSFGEATRRLADVWANIVTERVVVTGAPHLARNVARWGIQLFGGGAGSVGHARALLDTSPLRTLLEGELGAGAEEFRGLAHKLASGRLEALAVTATSYRTGKALSFAEARQLEPRANWSRPYREGRGANLSVNHVLASCALPLLFPAVKIGGEWCGDGSIRQSAPLSPAVHLGARSLLVISTARPPPQAETGGEDPYPSPARVAGVVVNALMFDSTQADATYAARVTSLLKRAPDQSSSLRPIDVLLIRPTEDLGQLAASYEQHLPKVLRHLTRGWGTLRSNSSDLLATLLFESAYTSRLIELGRADADRRVAELEAFVQGRPLPTPEL